MISQKAHLLVHLAIVYGTRVVTSVHRVSLLCSGFGGRGASTVGGGREEKICNVQLRVNLNALRQITFILEIKLYTQTFFLFL